MRSSSSRAQASDGRIAAARPGVGVSARALGRAVEAHGSGASVDGHPHAGRGTSPPRSPRSPPLPPALDRLAPSRSRHSGPLPSASRDPSRGRPRHGRPCFETARRDEPGDDGDERWIIGRGKRAAPTWTSSSRRERPARNAPCPVAPSPRRGRRNCRAAPIGPSPSRAPRLEAARRRALRRSAALGNGRDVTRRLREGGVRATQCPTCATGIDVLSRFASPSRPRPVCASCSSACSPGGWPRAASIRTAPRGAQRRVLCSPRRALASRRPEFRAARKERSHDRASG